VVDVVSAIFVGNLLVLVPVTALVHGTNPGLTPAALAAFGVAGLLGSLLARIALFVGIDRLGPGRQLPPGPVNGSRLGWCWELSCSSPASRWCSSARARPDRVLQTASGRSDGHERRRPRPR
jgi:hypothetical protein